MIIPGRTSVLRALWLLVGSVVLGAVVLLSPRMGQGPVQRRKHQPDELEERTRGVILRLQRKERLIQRHLAGELTLLETAAHFRALDNGPPHFPWQQFRELVPGASDEERHCREVIRHVRALLYSQDDATGQEKVERLEAELCEHLRHGPPRLPAVEPLADE